MPDYNGFTQAVAQRGNSAKAAFEALCELTRDTVGVKLFTVMSHDRENGVAQRIYSNMPEAYPVSGTKPANETDWSKTVIDDCKTFVANDIKSIAAVFPDHELIRSLGCESVINVPIVVGGEVLGTINCLHEEGFYTEEKVAAAEALKLPGALCLLLNERNSKPGVL